MCGQLLSISPALCESTSQHEQPYATLCATLDSGCSTINAIMGSFGNSFTAFVFPTGAYLWVYRTAAARANAPKQPL